MPTPEPFVRNPLQIFFPNGGVEGVQVFVWDDDTLQPVLWGGQSGGGGTVNQGSPGTNANAWPVKPVVNGQPVSDANPFPITYPPGPLEFSGFGEYYITGNNPNTLIAPLANHRIRVYALTLTVNMGWMAANFESGVTLFSGTGKIGRGGSWVLDLSPQPWFVCEVGQPFVLRAYRRGSATPVHVLFSGWYTRLPE
jgi:hypothetical protein